MTTRARHNRVIDPESGSEFCNGAGCGTATGNGIVWYAGTSLHQQVEPGNDLATMGMLKTFGSGHGNPDGSGVGCGTRSALILCRLNVGLLYWDGGPDESYLTLC